VGIKQWRGCKVVHVFMFFPTEQMWHFLYSEQVSKFLSMHWGCRMWNFVTFYWVVDYRRLVIRIQVGNSETWSQRKIFELQLM